METKFDFFGSDNIIIDTQLISKNCSPFPPIFFLRFYQNPLIGQSYFYSEGFRKPKSIYFINYGVSKIEIKHKKFIVQSAVKIPSHDIMVSLGNFAFGNISSHILIQGIKKDINYFSSYLDYIKFAPFSIYCERSEAQRARTGSLPYR